MITVNGAVRDIELPLSVADLVRLLGHSERGIAIAIDDVVVPRARWSETSIPDGCAIEILTAVQGG